MGFYTFNQNNSGGSFHFDRRGISHYVIVEGETLDQIVKRAEEIGLYWDGCREGRDCECCGDRWHRPWDGDKLDPVPSIYGEPVESAKLYHSMKPKAEVFIHYLDGRIVPATPGLE